MTLKVVQFLCIDMTVKVGKLTVKFSFITLCHCRWYLTLSRLFEVFGISLGVNDKFIISFIIHLLILDIHNVIFLSSRSWPRLGLLGWWNAASEQWTKRSRFASLAWEKGEWRLVLGPGEWWGWRTWDLERRGGEVFARWRKRGGGRRRRNWRWRSELMVGRQEERGGARWYGCRGLWLLFIGLKTRMAFNLGTTFIFPSHTNIPDSHLSCCQQRSFDSVQWDPWLEAVEQSWEGVQACPDGWRPGRCTCTAPETSCPHTGCWAARPCAESKELSETEMFSCSDSKMKMISWISW